MADRRLRGTLQSDRAGAHWRQRHLDCPQCADRRVVLVHGDAAVKEDGRLTGALAADGAWRDYQAPRLKRMALGTCRSVECQIDAESRTAANAFLQRWSVARLPRSSQRSASHSCWSCFDSGMADAHKQPSKGSRRCMEIYPTVTRRSSRQGRPSTAERVFSKRFGKSIAELEGLFKSELEARQRVGWSRVAASRDCHR